MVRSSTGLKGFPDAIAAVFPKTQVQPMPGMTPERTRAFIAAEIDKWVPIVRATGATID
jgi:hypothetical protein